MTPKQRATKSGDKPVMTTVLLPRDVYERAKIRAIREQRTLRAFIEDAVRAALARKEET